jgi:hypothetical protein
LGVIFYSNLNFVPHITMLKEKCMKALDVIKVVENTKWGANRNTLLHLYCSLIRSKLDWLYSVWSSKNIIYQSSGCLCLFSFESHEQFFRYLATVTINGDKAANLDLCLALTSFSSEGSFTCHTYCDTGPRLRSYPKDP